MPLQAVVVRQDGPYQVVNAPGAPVLTLEYGQQHVNKLQQLCWVLATAASTRSSYTLVASRIR